MKIVNIILRHIRLSQLIFFSMLPFLEWKMYVNPIEICVQPSFTRKIKVIFKGPPWNN